jgi:hypothetical protein
MKRWIGLGLAAMIAAGPMAAWADATDSPPASATDGQAANADNAPTGADGHVALELASLVGIHSPSLTATQTALLNHYLTGHSSGHGPQFVVKAKEVQCRVSNVSIVTYSCEITFGAATRSLTARAAHELLATLVEAGVQGDGAMGTIYYDLTGLKCTLIPADIADNGGGGASCTFATEAVQ